MSAGKLSPRDRAVLALLAAHRAGAGAQTETIARRVPGGRPASTLRSLERRGLVVVNRRRNTGSQSHGASIAGAYITADGLEALLLCQLSQTGITNV